MSLLTDRRENRDRSKEHRWTDDERQGKGILSLTLKERELITLDNGVQFYVLKRPGTGYRVIMLVPKEVKVERRGV